MSEISLKASVATASSPTSATNNSTGNDQSGLQSDGGVVKIDAAKIKHMAHLSRIGISEADAEKYAVQMQSILDYMKILEEVNTDGVEMTLQVTDLKSVTRADEVKMEVQAEDLLAVSQLPQISGQIAVKAVIKED